MLNALSIDSLFAALGLLDGDDWLGGQPIAVILGLVYGYVPYLILPLYASLDRIDQRLIEAARDLGAPPRGAFRRVVLPLSKAGTLGGIVLIALPMFGDYYTPDLMSGSPQDGDARQHDQQLRAGRAGQGAGRGADAAAGARSCWSSCSITCATLRREEPREALARPPGRDLGLRRLVAAAGAAGDPLRVQRGALADVGAGLLAALVLDRPDAERAQRPDAVGGAAALAGARGAGDADRDAARAPRWRSACSAGAGAARACRTC